MILVPTDFTSVADCALNHALKLASILKVSIGLLHIVENDKHKDDALEKLKQIIETNSANNVSIEAIVEKGNILAFNGNMCNHGNKINTSGKTRISFDFRVISEEFYDSEFDKKSTGKNIPMTIGGYYDNR